MSTYNYITEMLELKEKNIIFKENCYYKEKIKRIEHKIFEGYLTYQPDSCPECNVIFDENFEKHGFITSNVKIPNVSGFKTILKLHKQRYLCKHCNKAFTLTTSIVNYGCFISNNTKHKIEISPKNLLGGVRGVIVKDNILIDYSFANKLVEEKANFSF